MVQVLRARGIDDLQGILALQSKNMKEVLTDNEMSQEGFVTLSHDIALLQLLHSYEPPIIALDKETVVGYALVMVPALKNEIPILFPMFEKFKSVYYKSEKISDSNYYVMGQICIERSYRGTGIFNKLYQKHKTELGAKYDYCVTEVSNSNTRSLKAHEKAGFKNIYSFTDEFDSWHIILLELNQ